MHETGQTAAQGASLQCMQAMLTDFSPGWPSLMVTTRRRTIPHGTSCSFLQATVHALHSMHRSASHRNFMRAILNPRSRSRPLDLTQRSLGLLHVSDRVIAVGGRRVCRLTDHEGYRARWIPGRQVLALPPAGKMEGHEHSSWPDARR